MSKGKYGARAVNREAARDNEIIVEKLSKIEQLTAELAEVNAQLAQERRERGAIVVRRADELSAEQIAAVREHHEQLAAQREEDMLRVAKFFCKVYREADTYPVGFLDTILPLLVPDAATLNELSDGVFNDRVFPEGPTPPGNRYTKRHSAQNITRGHGKHKSKDSGVELLVRKGTLPPEALEEGLEKPGKFPR